MSVEKGNRRKDEHGEHVDSDTPDEPMEEGLDTINSSNGDAEENVISDTHSEIEDAKHGRNNAKPITGANPKTI